MQMRARRKRIRVETPNTNIVTQDAPSSERHRRLGYRRAFVLNNGMSVRVLSCAYIRNKGKFYPQISALAPPSVRTRPRIAPPTLSLWGASATPSKAQGVATQSLAGAKSENSLTPFFVLYFRRSITLSSLWHFTRHPFLPTGGEGCLCLISGE